MQLKKLMVVIKGSITVALLFPAGDNQEHKIRHGHSHIIIDPDTQAQNCTVAYMAECMSMNKCRKSCDSMGSARFRWFHEYGCCECIGSTCLDFGKGECSICKY